MFQFLDRFDSLMENKFRKIERELKIRRKIELDGRKRARRRRNLPTEGIRNEDRRKQKEEIHQVQLIGGNIQ